jgi:hypothetical protein
MNNQIEKNKVNLNKEGITHGFSKHSNSKAKQRTGGMG